MNAEQLTELLLEEVKDIYHAEKQLVKALPRMAKACNSESLADPIKAHLAETQNQVARLEKVFTLLKTPAKAKPCKGMQCLIEEGSEAIENDDRGTLRDLAIIGAAQRVEHYEISAYGTARAIAEQIGNGDIVKLLQATEEEEKAADEKMSKIAGELYAAEEPEQEEQLTVSGNSRRARAASKRK
jgi:ferritin-like metal-binding protein YciE